MVKKNTLSSFRVVTTEEFEALHISTEYYYFVYRMACYRPGDVTYAEIAELDPDGSIREELWHIKPE